MMTPIPELAWPVVAFLLILLANFRLGQWLRSNKPPEQPEFDLAKLTAEHDEMKRRVNSMALSMGLKGVDK